jgi:uncharacterized membrane protein
MNRERTKVEEKRIDTLLSACLVCAICIAVLVTIFVIWAPKENEHYTDFFLLGENGTADGYPYQIIPGQTYPIYIGVGNHESQNTTYIIETWEMITEFDDATNITRITAMNPGDMISRTLASNETVIIPYNLQVKNTSYNREEFLLFKDSVPDSTITGFDRINASYQNLYLRVSVS